MMREEALLDQLERSGQHHVAEHVRGLEGDARRRLIDQLGSFDYALVRQLAELARAATDGGEVAEFDPAPVTPLSRPAGEIEASRRAGEAAIRAGRVGVFCVAGGQGSRLRFDGPKGCYRIGPVSGKTLFQIHAEKVLAARRRYGASIPLYVMTSTLNDAEVRAFFAEHGWFGLPPTDVFFCVQRMLPAFDPQGRFLLDAPGHVFVSPDGHGGAYFALDASGALDDMARRGIRHLSYFQVDNPMVTAVDPVFIGEHVRTGSEMSSKVLRKRDAFEKLGVFGYVGSELRVVEYSEIPRPLQEKRLPDGSLKYAFGSIAIHVIEAVFAARMAAADLPFHLARKRIPCLGPDGRMSEPEGPNGIKLERFVFDGVPFARNPLVLEVRREDEFAPVKNFEGADSAETARAAMTEQHRRWLEQAGLRVRQGCTVEISPLFALDAADLAGKVGGLEVTDGLYLG